MQATENAGIETLFDTAIVPELERRHLELLGAGVLGAIQVKEFFTPEQCGQLLDGLAANEMGSYDERVLLPRIAKLGPAAYDFYRGGELDEAYWSDVEAAELVRAGLMDGRDPLTMATDKLGTAWGGDVRPASARGRRMFAGIIREIAHGARLHFDEVNREFPGVMDETPISQLAFNCHLSMPAAGGEAVVHRRRWSPEDEIRREGYGYVEDIAAGYPAATVRPDVGDAILFDPRNYHLVRQNAGEGRRITLSFFVGITGSGPLTVWS
ncbi:2OG-Fe(II)-dependent halogenase WelO5 family protein [Streptomyces sp. NPDC054829]